MMRPYKTVETLARLIEQIEKWRELKIEGGKTIAYVMIMLKGITPLVQTATFNKDIW